jgi:Icc-related predicted phosphoesterase
LRLLHVSDTHGTFPDLDLRGVDVVVHSGDLFRNFSRGGAGEQLRQHDWLEAKAERVAGWLKGVPMLYVPGNHDFLNSDHACSVLSSTAGVRCESLCERSVRLKGLHFYGIPWCPYFGGEWNYETTEDKIAEAYARVPKDVDVLVSHCPPKRQLDLVPSGENIGSLAAFDWFARRGFAPKVWLFGHAHEAFGLKVWNSTLLSNAAGVQHVIEE